MSSRATLKKLAGSLLKTPRRASNALYKNGGLLPERQPLLSGIRLLHTLEPLPFEHALGLEPALSAKTIRLAHNDFQKHWVESLNKMVIGTDYEDLSLENTIMRSSQIFSDRVVYNTASQIWNSRLCLNSLTKEPTEMPSNLEVHINNSFGSYEKFIDEIHIHANTLFGGGFLWLVNSGGLKVIVTPNAESPIFTFKPAKNSTKPEFIPAQLTPERDVLLGINLWGYSYILDHELDRKKYVNAVLSKVDWLVVFKRFKSVNPAQETVYFG